MPLKEILVTGGAGFIGSCVTRLLLSEGLQVTVVDDLSTGRAGNLPSHAHLRFLRKNILDCDPKDFPKPPDAVLHLAGSPSVQYSWDRSWESHQNNLSSTLHALELCRSFGASRFVLASSAAVYGDTQEVPIKEETPKNPMSPYGLQKSSSEEYVRLYAERFSITAVALRLFNVFGPLQDPKSPYSGVISMFARLMEENRPLPFYGDGLQRRDFIYVEDVARAFLASIEVPRDTFTVCNVATGQATSLHELMEYLSRFYPKWKKEICYTQRRKGDILHSVADVRKAKEFLGFEYIETVSSGFEKMMQEPLFRANG